MGEIGRKNVDTYNQVSALRTSLFLPLLQSELETSRNFAFGPAARAWFSGCKGIFQAADVLQRILNHKLARFLRLAR
jgi:hypothetical protein